MKTWAAPSQLSTRPLSRSHKSLVLWKVPLFFFTPFSPQILLRAYLPGEGSMVNAIVAGRATILSSLWHIWGSPRQASRIPDSERCRSHEDSPPAPSPSAPTDEWARRSNWLFWLQIRHHKEGKELECNLSSSHKPDANMTSAYAKEAVLPKLKACLPTPKTSTCCDQRNRYLPLSKVELTTEIKKTNKWGGDLEHYK